jgi:hypothetical protein
MKMAHVKLGKKAWNWAHLIDIAMKMRSIAKKNYFSLPKKISQRCRKFFGAINLLQAKKTLRVGQGGFGNVFVTWLGANLRPKAALRQRQRIGGDRILSLRPCLHTSRSDKLSSEYTFRNKRNRVLSHWSITFTFLDRDEIATKY